MEIKRVGAGRGLAWVAQSLDIAGRRPAAVLGGALLALVALCVLAIAAVLLSRVFGGGATGAGSLIRQAGVAMLLLLAVQPVLLAGLLHLLREADAGRPVSAGAVFAGFRGEHLLPLVALSLVQVAALGLNLLALDQLGGEDYLGRYFAMLQSIQPGQPLDPASIPQPEHGGLLDLASLVIGYFSTAVLALSVPLVFFRGLPPATAVLLALRASVVNVLPLLLAALVLFVGLLLAALVIALLSLVVGAVGRRIAPALGALLSLGVLVLALTAVAAMLPAIALLAWREIFGDTGQAAAPSEVAA